MGIVDLQVVHLQVLVSVALDIELALNSFAIVEIIPKFTETMGKKKNKQDISNSKFNEFTDRKFAPNVIFKHIQTVSDEVIAMKKKNLLQKNVNS